MGNDAVYGVGGELKRHAFAATASAIVSEDGTEQSQGVDVVLLVKLYFCSAPSENLSRTTSFDTEF